MRATVGGRLGEFCGDSCFEGFRGDRRHGLIYGASAVRLPDGSVKLSRSREEWSRDTGLCAYCAAPVAVAS